MRLFDKVAATCRSQIADSIRQNAGRMTVLCVDAIAEHYGTSQKDDWDSCEYPYARPPWELCFVEWDEPKTWTAGGKSLPNIGGYKQAGLLCECVERRQDLEAIVASYKSHWPAAVDGISSEIALVINSVPFVFVGGSAVEIPLRGVTFLRSDGWVLRHAVKGELFKSMPQEMQSQLTQEIGGFLHIAYLAFTFANCSNVKLQDSTEDLQPPAKIRRRLKLPEVKRYTLNIAGHVARPSREYGQGPQGVMPFHLCRGHFATYTAEKPMFGNPKLVGRYWHPPHMKGKKENGEIVKDYAIQG